MPNAHQTNKELAAPKDAAAYDWYEYTGKPLSAANDKGRKLSLKKGDKFGVRKSGNGKHIRLVTGAGGPGQVFTCELSLATLIGKRCKPARI